MKIKQIASIAIIAALPFVANAEQTWNSVDVTPRVGANGIVTAAFAGPYATITPTQDDETHIATTAYVKGAYNGAIAAINTVQDNKQDQLYTSTSNEPIFMEVVDIGTINVENMFAPGYNLSTSDHLLMSAGATIQSIKNQRVRIYTTWDDDTATATTLVPFEMVQ